MKRCSVHNSHLHSPPRWGLPAEVVEDFGDRLRRFWLRFRRCFTTRTRDPSPLAFDYLRALLTINRGRNFTNIERRLHGGDGQRTQHFMSYSPWAAAAVLEQIRREIVSTPELDEGGTLILDECADEKAGDESAGAARQYNGRTGAVNQCRVDTCLVYANLRRRLWTLIDGEMFIPVKWFADEQRPRRERTGIPAGRQFATKIDLGLRMIERCRADGLRFDVVACDSLYGRDQRFRAALSSAGITYAAQVPGSTLVRAGAVSGGRACVATTKVRAREASELARDARTRWRRFRLRYSERGLLAADFAIFRVRVAADGRQTSAPGEAEWLVIRKVSERRRQYRYTLVNTPSEVPLERVIELSVRRYFVERTFQDAKSELGWADFQARKYRAWEHHLALVAAALWFAAQTKLEWERAHRPEIALALELGVAVLPALSTANLRELLRAVLPLAQLSPADAALSVIDRLVRRARSITSRLQAKIRPNDTS